MRSNLLMSVRSMALICLSLTAMEAHAVTIGQNEFGFDFPWGNS